MMDDDLKDTGSQFIDRFIDLQERAAEKNLPAGARQLLTALFLIDNSTFWKEKFNAPLKVVQRLTGMNKDSIRTHRSMLSKAGLIRYSKGDGAHAAEYSICFDESSAEIPPSSAEIPPSSAEIPPSSAEIPPSSAEIPPSSAEIPPSSAEIPPSSAEIPPSSAEIPPIHRHKDIKTIEDIKTKERETTPKKKFKKPTLEEIQAYVNEKGYVFDPGQFFDYYESKGWLVGKSPMKNWKAACSTWNRRELDRHPWKSRDKGYSEQEAQWKKDIDNNIPF